MTEKDIELNAETAEAPVFTPAEGEDTNVILAVLKLSRAMRRSAAAQPRRDMPFPPAVMRTLHVIEKQGETGAAELCEILDVRPSSLSELLARMENDGLITRTQNEADRRQSRIRLTDLAAELLRSRRAARESDAEKLAACFTDEEAKTFCELSRKLSEHLESLGGEDFPHRHGCRRGPHGPEGCCHGPRGPHGPEGCHKGPHGPEGCHKGPHGGDGCHKGPHAPHFPRHPRFF